METAGSAKGADSEGVRLALKGTGNNVRRPNAGRRGRRRQIQYEVAFMAAAAIRLCGATGELESQQGDEKNCE
jgi:hypothetical protein